MRLKVVLEQFGHILRLLEGGGEADILEAVHGVHDGEGDQHLADCARDEDDRNEEPSLHRIMFNIQTHTLTLPEYFLAR